MIRNIFFSVLIGGIITCGCSTVHPAKELPTRRPLGKDLPTFEASSTSPASAGSLTVVEAPKGQLTMLGAWAAALMHNPELAAFSWEVRAAEAKTLQAGLMPNPEIGLTVENVGGSGTYSWMEEGEITLDLRYLFELGGKREKRAQLAQFETERAGWDYEKRRIEVLTEVAGRFIDVLAAQRHLKLARQNMGLASKVLHTVDRQIQGGAISPIEYDKQLVETISSRVALEQAQRRLTAARHRLAATWGSREPEFQSAVGAFETIRPIPSIQALADLVSQNPDVARWTAEMATRRAELKLAEAEKIPDLSAGVGVRRFNQSHDTALVFEISMPIPLFDLNQGNVMAAQSKISKAIKEQKAAEVSVRAALSSTYEEMSGAYTEAVALRAEALPAARRSFDKAQTGFQRGYFDYLGVLDAQRTLFRIREQYVDALAAYHRAVAQLEGLIGQSIESLEGETKQTLNRGELSHDQFQKK
ncbi:MAG: TolC family protein [Deltaproteobacteria bacterium]|jgi:outer membrane protein, heavy metal efflux system